MMSRVSTVCSIRMTWGRGQWPMDFRKSGWFPCARYSEKSVRRADIVIFDLTHLSKVILEWIQFWNVAASWGVALCFTWSTCPCSHQTAFLAWFRTTQLKGLCHGWINANLLAIIDCFISTTASITFTFVVWTAADVVHLLIIMWHAKIPLWNIKSITVSWGLVQKTEFDWDADPGYWPSQGIIMLQRDQWWRDLFRCRIDLLNFSMGFNIVAPYMVCVSHKWISPSLRCPSWGATDTSYI